MTCLRIGILTPTKGDNHAARLEYGGTRQLTNNY